MNVTVRELLDKGLWDRYCDITGTNPWALNEGLMADTETVELDSETASKLFLGTE